MEKKIVHFKQNFQSCLRMCYPIPIRVQEKWASKSLEKAVKICSLCGAEVSVKTQIAICWQESSVQSGFNYF